MRSYLSAIGAVVALNALLASAQTPDCLDRCQSQTRSLFPNFGCVNADDAGCLCANSNFVAGIRDCALQGCGATEADTQAFLTAGFCPNVSPPQDAPASSAAPPATTAPPAETQAPPATSAAPESSAPPAPESSAPPAPESSAPPSSSVPAPVSSEAPPAAESTSAAPATTAAPSSSSTEAPSGTQTTSTSASASSTESAGAGRGSGEQDGANGDTDEEEEESGLSQGAVAGIAIGVVAVVLAALVVVWFLWRRRGAAAPKRRDVEISNPMPGAGNGRAYGSPDHESFEKYGDIEMTTRYEDMVPRTQPRVMV